MLTKLQKIIPMHPAFRNWYLDKMRNNNNFGRHYHIFLKSAKCFFNFIRP